MIMNEVAGIQTLPAELFIAIVKESMPRVRPTHVLPREIALSHVCSHWRTLILHEPLLWSKIEIYSAKSMERVTTYFERSGSALVDIFFDVWKADRMGKESIDQVVDFAIEQIHRWQRLRFFASRISTTRGFLCKIAELAAPNLQELRVLDDGPTQADDHLLAPQKVILNGGHPQLKTVQLEQLVAIPLLSNVTTLHLREHNGSLFCVNLSVIAALNEQCPSLTTFSIHGNFDHNSVTWNAESTPVLTMKSIQHLWLMTYDNLPAKMLGAVALPNLKSLWLQCQYQPFIQTLNSHLYRPKFPKLEYLTIQTFEFYLTQQLQSIFPSVKNLHFPGCNSWNLGSLCDVLNTSWQEVESLALRTRGDGHPKKFTKLLGDLIEARRNGPGHPLERVLLDQDALRCFSKPDVVVLHDLSGVLEELKDDNYDDPWWIVIKADKGIFH